MGGRGGMGLAEPCGWPALLLPPKLSAPDLQPLQVPFPSGRGEVADKGHRVSGCEEGRDPRGQVSGNAGQLGEEFVEETFD